MPEKLRELAEDLAHIDALLRDEKLLSPIEAHWDREAEQRGRWAKAQGRPRIPMQTYVAADGAQAPLRLGGTRR